MSALPKFVNPVRLYVEDSGGRGRPVVLIHGWPLSSAAWQAQLGPLREAGYRVIAYDRRGFGRSDKPAAGYDCDHLADDLASVLDELDLHDATLVGFSMGGGEVARYIRRYGQARLRSVVFASAVPPYLLKTVDNPEGPLSRQTARGLVSDLTVDRDAFFEDFTKGFFTARGEVKATDAQRSDTVALCRQADQRAALGCVEAFGSTDFREDLAQVGVPTLVLHGDADAIVPLEGSGARTHAAVAGSELVVIPDAPHGCNLSHAEAFNRALLDFLRR